MKKIWQDKKEHELRVVNGGKEQGLFVQSSLCPSIFEGRWVPFLQLYRRHLSFAELIICFRGKPKVLSAHAISQMPSAYNIKIPKCRTLGKHSSIWKFPKKFHGSETEVNYPITQWISLRPGNRSVLSNSCLSFQDMVVVPILGLYTVWLLILLAFKKGHFSCTDFCQFSQDPSCRL